MRAPLRVITPLLFVAGLALMIPFEETITLALGVACLLAFVGLGVFLIAHPSALLGADDADQEPRERTTPAPPP